MCFLDTLCVSRLKHSLLCLFELRYLTGTLKASKDKMPGLWEVNTVLGARFPTQLTRQHSCHCVSSGQVSRKTHYWLFWSLFTTYHILQCLKKRWALLNFTSLMSGSSIKKPNSSDHPFYLSSLSNSRQKKYTLVLPSHSFSSACRCHWVERRVIIQPWITLLSGKSMHKDKVGEQRREWKGALWNCSCSAELSCKQDGKMLSFSLI